MEIRIRHHAGLPWLGWRKYNTQSFGIAIKVFAIDFGTVTFVVIRKGSWKTEAAWQLQD
jgi:hypothetical protein